MGVVLEGRWSKTDLSELKKWQRLT